MEPMRCGFRFTCWEFGPGDECITTANTFFATAEAIWIANATAVFVDSDPRTHCIDPTLLKAAITPTRSGAGARDTYTARVPTCGPYATSPTGTNYS